MSFGEKLESLRIKSGLNKKQLAEKVDVSPDTLGLYTKKETTEGIDSIRLKKIADFFELPVDYFMGDDDKSFINIQELDYINNVESLDYIKFISEIKYAIENYKLMYDGAEIKTESQLPTTLKGSGL